MKKPVYLIGDCSEEELYIDKDYSGEWEPDGEFAFATLKECQDYCLNLIDRRIKELQRARKRIIDAG